jgi:hypothetical protein
VIDAYRKYRAGEISKSDFRQQLAKRGCEGLDGLVGSVVYAVIGELLIPLPFVGTFIGGTLGNLTGRWRGAMIGKTHVNVK